MAAQCRRAQFSVLICTDVRGKTGENEMVGPSVLLRSIHATCRITSHDWVSSIKNEISVSYELFHTSRIK